MFYVIQNEDDYQHPNAFFVPSSGRAATMGDFLSHFPLVSEAFHFRFQVASPACSSHSLAYSREPAQADDESGSYLWLDAPTDPDVEIPDYSGRILCKALRLGGTSCSSYFVRFCTAHRQKGVGQCTNACSRSCCEQEASTCETASSEGASMNLLEPPVQLSTHCDLLQVVTQPAPAVSTPTLSPVRTPSAPVRESI